jgi:hypothetical protein
MPSLSPGTPGAKEVYGISVIRDDLSFALIPKAAARYGVVENDTLIMVTGHRKEPGFGLMRLETAREGVFRPSVETIADVNEPYWIKGKAYTKVTAQNDRVWLNQAVMDAYLLKTGDPLLVVKSTTGTMGHIPRMIWEQKLKKHGFFEAMGNIDKLEVY